MSWICDSLSYRFVLVQERKRHGWQSLRNRVTQSAILQDDDKNDLGDWAWAIESPRSDSASPFNSEPLAVLVVLSHTPLLESIIDKKHERSCENTGYVMITHFCKYKTMFWCLWTFWGLLVSISHDANQLDQSKVCSPLGRRGSNRSVGTERKSTSRFRKVHYGKTQNSQKPMVTGN